MDYRNSESYAYPDKNNREIANKNGRDTLRNYGEIVQYNEYHPHANPLNSVWPASLNIPRHEHKNVYEAVREERKDYSSAAAAQPVTNSCTVSSVSRLNSNKIDFSNLSMKDF